MRLPRTCPLADGGPSAASVRAMAGTPPLKTITDPKLRSSRTTKDPIVLCLRCGGFRGKSRKSRIRRAG
jgi:hypothetical protein